MEITVLLRPEITCCCTASQFIDRTPPRYYYTALTRMVLLLFAKKERINSSPDDEQMKNKRRQLFPPISRPLLFVLPLSCHVAVVVVDVIVNNILVMLFDVPNYPIRSMRVIHYLPINRLCKSTIRALSNLSPLANC